MSGSHVEGVGLNVRIMIFADDVTTTLLMDRASAAALRGKLGAVLDRPPTSAAQQQEDLGIVNPG